VPLIVQAFARALVQSAEPQSDRYP